MRPYRTKNPPSSLDCILLFPPPAVQLVSPELGLPQLVAYLNKHRIKSEAFDLNFLFINEFVPRRKKMILDRVGQRLKKIKDNPLTKIVNVADFIRSNPSERPEPFDGFISNEILPLISELLSITPNVYDIRKITRMIKSLHDQVYDLFFNECVKPLCARSDIIGFSIVSPEQLVTVLYFSRLIKKDDPGKKIVIGGPWCTCTRRDLKHFAGIFKFVDFAVTGEGEIPLKELIKFLEGRPGALKARSIPGLAFLKKNVVFDTGTAPLIDLNTLPASNFENFGGYTSRNRRLSVSLPVLPVKGCYWNKCKFCHHAFSESGVRSKSADRVVDEIESLVKRYGVKEIDLASISTPLNLLIQIAKKLISRQIDVKWTCLFRAEPGATRKHLELLKLSGCSRLEVGLESSDQGFLDEMEKGLDLRVLDELLDLADAAGLKILLFFINFPFRARSEYTGTWEYVISRCGKIYKAVSQNFCLGRNCRILPLCGRRGSPGGAGAGNIRLAENNRYDTRSFSLPYRADAGLNQKDFLRITIEYSKKFRRRKALWQNASPIPSRSTAT